METDGYRIVHVDAGPAQFVRKEELFELMPAFTEDVAAFVAEHGPYDVAHANFWMSGMTALELKRRFGVPFAITFHALGLVRRQHQGKDDQFPDARLGIEAELVKAADRVIAECPQDEIDLVSLYGAEPGRLEMIPCGYDPEECHPIDQRAAREYLGLPLDARIILQLGRLVPRKGVDTVVRAAALVARDVPNTQLVIVGGDSDVPDPEATPELGRLFRLAHELRVEDRCLFTGRRPRDEIRYWYAAADVFATVPWYEPFGITPVEAMACGTPVAGARVGGIQYTVDDGSTGLLVPPRDEVALAGALTRVLTDDGLRQRLSSNAVERAARLFTWDRVAGLMEASLRGVVTEHRTLSAERGSQAIAARGFDQLIETLAASRARLSQDIAQMAHLVVGSLRGGHQVLVCGNGGSAADAMHLAGELVARYRAPDRPGLPAIVLGSDLASLTAWSNDVSYESALARQVEAFGRPGDVLVAFSTSGRSPNVVQACEAARRRGLAVVAFTGCDGGDVRPLTSACANVASTDTQRIQEVHGLLLHLLCDLIEDELGYRVNAQPVAALEAAS